MDLGLHLCDLMNGWMDGGNHKNTVFVRTNWGGLFMTLFFPFIFFLEGRLVCCSCSFPFPVSCAFSLSCMNIFFPEGKFGERGLY